MDVKKMVHLAMPAVAFEDILVEVLLIEDCSEIVLREETHLVVAHSMVMKTFFLGDLSGSHRPPGPPGPQGPEGP